MKEDEGLPPTRLSDWGSKLKRGLIALTWDYLLRSHQQQARPVALNGRGVLLSTGAVAKKNKLDNHHLMPLGYLQRQRVICEYRNFCEE